MNRRYRSCAVAAAAAVFATAAMPVVFALDECEEEEPVVPVDEARVNDWGEGKPVSPEDAPVPCRQAVRIPLLNRGSVTLVDYASAGQESGHKVCAWLRVR